MTFAQKIIIITPCLTSGPENILKSKFQTGLTFEVVLIIIKIFNIVSECTNI